MTLLDILYSIFIGPLELLYDVVYTLFYYVTSNPGLSIVALSIFINVLLLPLYNRADKIQEEEKNIENKLKPGVDHIKKHFKDDEQYMLIQTYYRQNNYKPYYSLKGLLPLLLEIPFFIAAYNYLSNLSILNGASFFMIDNLKQPDGLLNGINLLPILMTIINIVSSSIYTKGDSLKSKIQLYGMALIFLVLLYNSPSGLVMYWTLNNLFSLIKNILIKLDNCNLIVSISCSIISILGIIFIVFIHPLATLIQTVGVCTGLLLLQLPIIFYLLNKNKVIKQDKEIVVDNKIFYLSCLFLCVLTGLLIPSSVIGASPYDFVSSLSLYNPSNYVLKAFCLSLGMFMVWFNVYYALLDNKIKKIICPIVFFVCVVSIVDYMFFGTNLGTLSELLVFYNDFKFSTSEIIINIFVIIAVAIVSLAFYYRKKRVLYFLCCSIVISTLIISVRNIITVNKQYDEIYITYTGKRATANIEESCINLSKDKENVVVLVLDKVVGMYFPYLINEKPELINQFQGFTYYPNTASFGLVTNIAVPAVYGGYEYTPNEINKRANETMQSKYIEATKVLPKLFSDNDFKVSMYDTAYAGFKEIPDMSIYNDIDNVKTYTLSGRYKIDGFEYDLSGYIQRLNRKLFSYSIMKCSPLVLQTFLYNTGAYLSIEEYNLIWGVNFSKRDAHISSEFLSEYATLYNLSNITSAEEDNNTFMMLYNLTAHNPVFLQMPDYSLQNKIDNTEYDASNQVKKSIFGEEFVFSNATQVRYYHTDMLVMMKLGEWFDYLREIGVYDNTKIIIVSDHAAEFDLFTDMFLDNKEMSKLVPMLLVKDFNSKEFAVDSTFMTNADVATIATDGIIENPINPYTGREINSDMKKEEVKILYSNKHNINENNNNVFLPDTWITVHDDVYDMRNWKILE